MATTGTALSSKREKIVKINVDDKGNLLSVEPETFRVSKRAHHEVFWRISNPKFHFKITFDEPSPFHYPYFDHDEPYSGLVKREITGGDGRVYKYTVTVGGVSSDPGGVVDQ